MRNYFEEINENLLTDVCSRATLGQVRSGQVRSGQVRSGQVRSGQVRSGQVRDYRVKAQGRTALFLKYLKLNTQLMDNRRALG